MRKVFKFLGLVLLGLAMIAGGAAAYSYFGYRAGWHRQIYSYAETFRWHRSEILKGDIMRVPDRSSPLKSPPKRTILMLQARYPDENLGGHYTIDSSEFTPIITLDQNQISLEELLAALANLPVEYVRKADRFSFFFESPGWLENKTVYIRRDGDRILGIRILTDPVLPEGRPAP